MRKPLHGIVLLVGSLIATGAFAQADGQGARVTSQTLPATWELLTGVDYSVGSYGGTSDTTVISVPLNARIQMDRLRLELSISYLDVKGPGVFAGGIVIPGGAVSHRSGFGDTNVGAAWLIRQGDLSTPSVELAGTVKIPTATNDLGTTKFDYTAQANVYQALSSQFMLLGSIGYQWLGDFSTFNLENGVVATAGLNYKPNKDSSIGAIASYRQEYFHGLGNVISLSPYIVYNFAGMWRVSGYGLLGLTDASARWGGGLRIGLYQ